MSNHPNDDATRETIITGDFLEADPSEGVTQQHQSLTPEASSANHSGQPKYEVIRELGKGGFAWVYLVKNLDLDRLEAMKILNAELSEEEDVSNRFVKEAQISANFNHTNIITIFEVQRRGDWDNFKVEDAIVRRHREPFVYFTMSFIEGDTATNLIKNQGLLAQKQAIKIAIDACSALDYAHGKGVIHRDIKPDNILVDRRGNGIVMDFGIAKVVNQTRQTAAGTFMGTARYVSPEQAMGKEIDGRADLYSMGIALYELVTGRVPFDSDQWMTVLYQHINEPPPPPEKFYSSIHRDVRTIILKMLEKKPENRFQTAREAHDALASVYNKMGGQTLQTEAFEQIRTRKDLLQPDPQTQVTEITPRAIPEPGTKPPVRQRDTQAKAETPQAPAPQPRSPLPMIAGILGLLAVIAAAVYFLKPKPPVTPTPLGKGKLLISAFPTGQIIRLADENNLSIDIETQALPITLDLPEGTYKLVISYQGQTREITAFVAANLPLAKAHVAFDLEDELFLLEDLR